MRHATVLGAGALALSAVPLAEQLIAAAPAQALVTPDDATLQAFADTMIPGRKAERTDLGNEIHPQAIAGVDPLPGAVEADALALMKDPRVGFEALVPAFLLDLEGRALSQGGQFLSLPFDKRVAVCLSGLDFGNGSRTLWEAAAAVPFTAFCAAAVHPIGTTANASGYRAMGYPGAAPNGYRGFSYGRKLATERTRKGVLP
jgi:enediyne biosynthesis protein E8